MDYPLLISGVEQGRLLVEQHGLFTVFEAECPLREGLLRLSVYGDGKEGYLGLMQPWQGGLYLKRKLSRANLVSFPEEIEYAAEAGLEAGTASPESIQARPAPESCSCCDGIVWFRQPDGTLIGNDGKSTMIALPCALQTPAPGAVIKLVDGRAYMLFRY